jgi:hypothetical protein
MLMHELLDEGLAYPAAATSLSDGFSGYELPELDDKRIGTLCCLSNRKSPTLSAVSSTYAG